MDNQNETSMNEENKDQGMQTKNVTEQNWGNEQDKDVKSEEEDMM